MKMRLYVFLLMVCIYFPVSGVACVPVPRDPDTKVIKKAAAIITARVLSVEKNEKVDFGENLATLEVEIIKVFKGAWTIGKQVKVEISLFSPCNILYLEKGMTADLLIFKEKEGYNLGSSTDYLSPQDWEKLKNGNLK